MSQRISNRIGTYNRNLRVCTAVNYVRLLETEEIVEKKIDSQQGAKFLYSSESYNSHYRGTGIGKPGKSMFLPHIVRKFCMTGFLKA